MIISFFLSSCDKPNTIRQNFLSELQDEHDNGTSIFRINMKITSGEFATQQKQGYFASYEDDDTFIDDFDLQEYEESSKLYNQSKLEFIADIKVKNCDVVNGYINAQKLEFSNSPSTLEGIFLEEGICTDPNPAKAAEIYIELIKLYPFATEAMARLGRLYYEGVGVEQNTKLADYYFTKAVIEQATMIWLYSAVEFSTIGHGSVSFQAWNQTVTTLANKFANQYTGPWLLPTPLTNKIKWIKGLAAGEGKLIKEIAHHMHAGTGGYDIDIPNAIKWMGEVYYNYADPEALYFAALWDMQNDLCDDSEKDFKALVDCNSVMFTGLDAMETSAVSGSKKAIAYMIDYHINNFGQPWSDWILYQYLLVAKNNNFDYDHKLFDGLQSNLKPLEQQIIAEWIVGSAELHLGDYLPNLAVSK
jgi:hypothetical protein